ncbi:MAG: response regulator transcription factor [Deltaproteobacteria bacterium]|nr:response regulator transcription factor [Deltaproteobacteria bacterium]
MGKAYKYNILVVDDYAPVRRMVKEIIKGNPDLQVIGELSDGRELLKFLKKAKAHLILLDISMPNLGGFEATQEIKKSHPEVKVLILTIHKYMEYAERAMSLGAEGYLLKEDVGDELLPAISSLRQGRTFISPGLAA